jgi:hypothetical protein
VGYNQSCQAPRQPPFSFSFYSGIIYEIDKKVDYIRADVMMRNDRTHLVEQTWELVHQGQHVDPANSFLDSALLDNNLYFELNQK